MGAMWAAVAAPITGARVTIACNNIPVEIAIKAACLALGTCDSRVDDANLLRHEVPGTEFTLQLICLGLDNSVGNHLGGHRVSTLISKSHWEASEVFFNTDDMRIIHQTTNII